MNTTLRIVARAALVLCAALSILGASPVAWAQAAGNYTPDSIQFNGRNGLAFPPRPAFSIADGGTIEFWVSPDWKNSPDYDPVIVSSAGQQGISFLIALLRDRDGLAFAAGDEEYVVAFDFTDNKLHHVAVSQLSDGVVIFIDGKPVGSSPLKAAKLPAAGFWVGSIDGKNSPFRGVVAGLRIWKEAIGREELVRFALKDAIEEDHPDLDDLAVVSDFAKRELLVISQP
jgi:hypothetical protein